MFEKIIVELNGQQVELEIANTPKKLGDILGRQGYFCSPHLQNALNDNDVINQLRNISLAFATIYTIVGEQKLKDIYFPDSTNNVVTDLLKIIENKEIFIKGSKERKIAVEILRAYKKYNEKASELIDFDLEEEGLLFFRPQ